MTPEPPDFDHEALAAGVELVGRAGARSIDIGYLNDDPPYEWYAQAFFNGVKVIEEKHDDPATAVETLAANLLHEGTCRCCGKTITLIPDDPEKGKCRWKRRGNRWMSGCGKPINTAIPMKAMQRRR